MLKEGAGRVPPSPVRISIKDEIRFLHGEARRREKFRNYSARADRWGKGMLRGEKAEIVGGEIAMAVLPILIGMAGEWATVLYVNQRLGTSFGIDLMERQNGDGDTDLSAFGLRVQVKTRKLNSGKNLVRYMSESGYEYPLAADVFVFSEWNLTPDVQLLGCVGQPELKTWQQEQSYRGGHWNYASDDAGLLPVSRLTTELEGRRDVA